ncbi:MAG TPA: ubiquinol-cytochrome C chaperone family protein [Xanthobacteraceae bacterium]|nr:ubiquinol-cytochrome C chaperone family protein [Xanthobacteraceae bacterium]
MIFRLFRRDPHARTIAALYGAIVAQARRPVFYLALGVPDTVEGRFEMVALHLALLCRRLGRDGASGQSLSQGVFDMFCRDMDDHLREMGVSDLRVPKTMRKLGEAFYGRLDAYDRALADADDAALAAAVARNALGDASASAPRLTGYVRAAARRLDAVPLAQLHDGQVSFPDPAAVGAGVEAARA